MRRLRPSPTKRARRARERLVAVEHLAVGDSHGGYVAHAAPRRECGRGVEAVGRVLAHLIIPERDRDAHLRGLENYVETGEAPILDNASS